MSNVGTGDLIQSYPGFFHHWQGLGQPFGVVSKLFIGPELYQSNATRIAVNAVIGIWTLPFRNFQEPELNSLPRMQEQGNLHY